MADAESLKSFMISIGFDVDSGQQRRMQESLVNVEKNVNRFSQATQKSTGFLNQFFAFFQKSEGPMRQHTETTVRLTKSFELFGLSLKRIGELVATGALTKAFLDLNSQFEKLYYSAMRAGTSVGALSALKFAAEQVGIGGDAIVATVTNLRRALTFTPGAVQALAQLLKINVIDPATGGLRSMDQVTNMVIESLGRLYRQGPVGAAIAQQMAQLAGITIGPDLEMLLMHPELYDKFLEQQKRFADLAARVGVNLQALADDSTGFMRALRELGAVFGLLGDELAAPFIGPVRQGIEWLERELLHLNDVAKQAAAGMIDAFQKGGFEGLGAYLAQQLDAIDWGKLGSDAAQKFVDGMVAFFRADAGGSDKIRDALIAMVKGAVNQMLDDLREQLQKIPLLRNLPGVGQPGGAQVSPPGVTQLPDVNVQGLPSHQHGGIVPTTGPAMLHAGEGVVTADAMSGLSRLGPIMEDLWEGFRNWWFGGGSYHPGVVVTNFDELIQALHPAEDGGGYPGNAGGRGPRGRFAIGAPREPEAAPPLFANIAEQRRPLMEEIARNPATKQMLMQMMATEGGGAATLEALFNRVSLIRQKIANYTIGEELRSGFYGPINRGEAQLRAISAGAAAQYQRLIDQVAAGSNVIQGRVNQGMPTDPGANLPGRIRIPGSSEIYNFWEGMRKNVRFSVEDSARFAEQEGRLANVLASAPLGTTNSYRAGDKTVTLNAQANFNISGTDALSVGGAVNSVQSRTNADLLRNLSPIVQ